MSKAQFDGVAILGAARAHRNELQLAIRRIEALIQLLDENTSTTVRSGRGRPKGSKNRVKAARVATKSVARGKRGRPSKETSKTTVVAKKSSSVRASRKPATPRAKGMSLIRAVAQVLAESNSPLSVSQIAEGVSKLGVNTKASSFKTMVSQSLGKLSELKVVESKERGIWQSSNGISKYLGDEATSEPAADNIPI